MHIAISILRGINVGGQKKIPMAELKALYGDLKLKNVVTYIQSGNVIFSAGTSDPEILRKKIEKKIFEKYQFEVPVLIRTIDELKFVLNHNPFIKEKGIDTDRLYVTFLRETPGKDHLEKIKAYHFEPDRFIILDKTVYLSCPVSYGESKLNNNFFENKLKVTATTRNWRTVNELLKIALSI